MCNQFADCLDQDKNVQLCPWVRIPIFSWKKPRQKHMGPSMFCEEFWAHFELK